MHCPNCGFPLDRRNLPEVCPKCDEHPLRKKASRPQVVDLVHGGETISQALAKLEVAVSECLWHGRPSLKVIHGHGSGSGISRIKPHVLSAMRKHAERFGGQVVPDGENPGAHILRFK